MKKASILIDEGVDIELSATQIPLSIFTNLVHKRFEKHSMLESMLEILEQFYRLGVARPFLMLEAFFLTLP